MLHNKTAFVFWAGVDVGGSSLEEDAISISITPTPTPVIPV